MHCPRCKGFVEDGSSVCPTCNAPLYGQRRGVGITKPPSRPAPIYADPRPYVTTSPDPGIQTPPAYPPPAPPYPPPGHPPVPTGPRPGQEGLGTIAIIVFAVVIIVLVATIAAVYLWGPDYDDPGYELTTVNIASPSVNGRDVGGTFHWDAILNINKITPKDERIGWNQLRIVVKSADGSVLNPHTPLDQDLGIYDDDLDGSVDVEFWFIETTGDGFMSAGDAIKITGMTRAYEGATIELTVQGERVGSIVLPTVFP